MAETGREPGRNHAVAWTYRRDRSPVVPRCGSARLPGDSGVRDLRRPHAPHQRGLRRADRSERAQAGVNGDGGGVVSGGDARGSIPQTAASQEDVELVADIQAAIEHRAVRAEELPLIQSGLELEAQES